MKSLASQPHTVRVGAQLIPYFDQRNALRRTVPLIPFSWADLRALLRAPRRAKAPARRDEAEACHSH
ncbi:hypothetical protein CEG14_01830 [Bordetella genomosp. 1]|uniref:Uncharacterized protein n=1 Tax=Bordetella genomosp. 1 TaxID=1395607 RepID=A0A261ST19_9BORD|nr:hypothetical protein [Bordetella genomosp. 1]OZI40529.1 hypothetical protein CEG14_01830 [Bordetella genomosp. 1]